MTTTARPKVPVQAQHCFSESRAREIGRRLQEARLALGLELATLAESSFTQPSDLEALERGEFEAIASRRHLPVFLRVYGNHLRLSGEELVQLLEISTDHLAPPVGPELHERARGSQHRAATMVTGFLLLIAAAGIGYYTLHRLHPGIAEAVLSAVDPRARDETTWADDARSAAARPATNSGLAAVAVADHAVSREGQPLTSGIAEPEPIAAARRPAAVQPTIEAAPVLLAETARDNTSVPPDDLYAPGGSSEARPEVAGMPSNGSPASKGSHISAAQPVAPVPVDSSPDATSGTVEEPLALSSPAQLRAAAPPIMMPAAPAGAAKALPPLEDFAAHPSLVRPSAWISSRFVTPRVGPRQGPTPIRFPVTVGPQRLRPPMEHSLQFSSPAR